MKISKLLSIFSLVLLSSSFFVSCESDSNQINEIDSRVISKLQSIGFDTAGIYEDTMLGKSGFVVEGDIFLTMKDIESLAKGVELTTSNQEEKHYRTNNIVGPDGRVVSVYMDVAFNATMQAAFDEAIDRFNNLGLDIIFQRASSEGADIDILSQKLRRVPGGGVVLGRSAGFPDANGDPATPIVLNSDIYNPRRGDIPADATTVIAHEIGHAIGFRHTDWFDRGYSCGRDGNEGEGDIGAVLIDGTPATVDPDSWMLACSNGTDRPFTANDVIALQTVY